MPWFLERKSHMLEIEYYLSVPYSITLIGRKKQCEHRFLFIQLLHTQVVLGIVMNYHNGTGTCIIVVV